METDRDLATAADLQTEPAQARATRRWILVLGGLMAGGRNALAAPDGPDGKSATAEARLKLALKALETVRANVDRGLFGPGERDPIAIWSRRRMEARLELATSKRDRIAAVQENIDELKRVEQLVETMRKVGQVDELARIDAEYRRLEAESLLEKEKRA